MPNSFTVPIDDVQPSQLYVNGEKLAAVSAWFDFEEPNYEPLPVIDLDGDLVLTDGHTRAFVAAVSGADEIRVVVDEDDLPLDRYAECVGWCEDEDVTDVFDLVGRVLGEDAFERRWIDRCHAAADELEDEG